VENDKKAIIEPDTMKVVSLARQLLAGIAEIAALGRKIVTNGQTK